MASLPCLKVILEMRDDRVDLPELQSIRLGSHAFSFSWNRNEKLIMRSGSDTDVWWLDLPKLTSLTTEGSTSRSFEKPYYVILEGGSWRVLWRIDIPNLTTVSLPKAFQNKDHVTTNCGFCGGDSHIGNIGSLVSFFEDICPSSWGWLCCVLVCFNIQHINSGVFQIIHFRAIFPELNAIRNTDWVSNQEGVFSLLMMHQLLLYAGIEITKLRSEVSHLLREKRLHQRQQLENIFMSLLKAKCMQRNTHSSIQADYTNPISLLHKLTQSIILNRWRITCSMAWAFFCFSPSFLFFSKKAPGMLRTAFSCCTMEMEAWKKRCAIHPGKSSSNLRPAFLISQPMQQRRKRCRCLRIVSWIKRNPSNPWSK